MKTYKSKSKGKTNWKKLAQLSETEIEQCAWDDADNPLLSLEELKKFKPVHPPEMIPLKKARQLLNCSQEQFASYFGVSVRTLQEWEQGRRKPHGPARTLLKVIIKEPKAVQRALREDR